MVSRLEYLGEDFWEHGFDIDPGCSGALVDTGPSGKEELYYIICAEDNSHSTV